MQKGPEVVSALTVRYHSPPFPAQEKSNKGEGRIEHF